ncbi:NAD-dependent protein deacetylase sirtuin-1-like [Patiria miniata]|uniref:protein acetyllysine N-acetyltransferase n=1 Tax=Patiria miniata TaxID=46514 RepID=A0A914AEQ7_PATMI|nr:NAD-dependent protein deacetylase sirtuin-1-like [Patiria miniata]
MADFSEISSLESPKKRPRLDNDEPNDVFTSGIDKENTHVPTSREIKSIHSPGSQLFEGKHLLNFDPESGAGFEHELPDPSDATHRDDLDNVPSHFNNDYLPKQHDSCEHDHCLPSQTSSSSPPASDTNASTGQGSSDRAESDEGEDEDSSSASEEGSMGSLDEEDLDLGLGECQLEQSIGPMGWLQRQMMSGVHPRSILSRLLPTVSASLPEDLDEFEVWSIIADYFQMLRDPPRRKKLPDFNTLDDALHLLRVSKRIMVLTGAGVSVSCGIPDFRSRDGVYARLAVDFPDLPDPQALFDIHYFRRNPRPFFKFAKEIYPGEFRPSTCHKFIALLEQHGKLLRNFSQNIDTLEQVAGITRVLQCHGSFATAHCTNCNYEVDAETIRPDIFNQVVPLCPRCPQGDPDILAVMKPDIVFFGEGLPKDFYHCLDEDKDKADLLIVIGSSLKVQPVATIPNAIPGHVPQILINREPLNHMTFDIELLGDGDVIVNEICRRLGEGWDQICDGKELAETSEMPAMPDAEESNSTSDDFETAVTPERVEKGFEGADSTSWISGSESQEETKHSPDDEQGVFQQVGNNSDKADMTHSMNCDDPGELSGPCRMPKNAEPANAGQTREAVADSNTSTSNTGPHATSASDTGDLQQETQPSQQCQDSGNQIHSAREPEPEQDIDSRPQTPENNGAQNCDISSTVYEDEFRTQDANGGLNDNAAPSESSHSEICETNEAVSQATKVSEDIGNSSKATESSIGSETLDNGSNGGDVASILKTQDEATPSYTRPKRKRRSSIALYLESSSYLFVPPNRYIFHGAEVFPPSRPVSPRAADSNNPDNDKDRSPEPPEDHHDNDDITAHQIHLVDRNEMPSTSDALMDNLLQEHPLPQSESSSVDCGTDVTQDRSTDHILCNTELPTSESYELQPGKDTAHGHEISPLLPENSAFHAGKEGAELSCSEKVDIR